VTDLSPVEEWSPGSGGQFDEQFNEADFLRNKETANRLSYLMSVNPMLASDPDAARMMATMPYDIDELGRNSSALYGTINLDNMMRSLQTQSESQQRAVWQEITEGQRNALNKMGYSPPSAPGGATSIPGLGPAASLAGGFMGIANTVLTAPVVGEVFDGLMWVGDTAGRLYRSVRVMDTDAQLAALAGGVAAGAGLIAAPFTAGLSLGVTAAVVGGGALVAGQATGEAYTLLTDGFDELGNALNSGWDGERVFTRDSQRAARALLQTDQMTALAKDIAWEDDLFSTAMEFAEVRDSDKKQLLMNSIQRIADRMAPEGDARREQVIQQLMTLTRTESFLDAVRTLQEGKISFGRDLARLAQLEEGSTTYNLVSGTADALFVITLDPTLAVGKAVSWNRALRLGVPIMETGPETVRAIEALADTNGRIGQAIDIIASSVDAEDFSQLSRNLPAARGQWSHLLTYKRLRADQVGSGYQFTRDEYFNWLKDGKGMELMLRGEGVQKGYGRLILPTAGIRVPLTSTILPSPRRAPLWAKAVIDFADDNRSLAHARRTAKTEVDRLARVSQEASRPVNALAGTGRVAMQQIEQEYVATKMVMDALDAIPVVNTVIRQFGALGGSLTSMLPMSNAISMVGVQSSTDVARLVEMGRIVGMRSTVRREWANTIMAQRSLAARMDTSMAFLDEMLTVAGARLTPEGDALVERFINHAKQKYSVGDLDLVNIDGVAKRRAVIPSDIAYELLMPDLKALRQASQKGLILKHLYQVTDSRVVEAAMNDVWKPMVLLRLGFILRAGGEELLSLVAKAGPSKLLADFGVRSVAEGELYDDAIKALRAGDLITDAQAHAMAKYRYAAHVRPLERMLNWRTVRGVEQAMPKESVLLGSYSDWLRNSIREGVLSPSIQANLPDKFRRAILGEDNSLRQMVLMGADPKRIEFAKLYQDKFAQSVLRELSAQDANIYSDRRQQGTPFTLQVKDPGTGDLVDLEMRRVPGTFSEYRQGDPVHARMGHYQITRFLDDPVVSRPFRQAASRWVPADVSDAVVNDITALLGQFGSQPAFEMLARQIIDPSKMQMAAVMRTMRRRFPGMAESLGTLPGSPTVDQIVNAIYDGAAKVGGKRGELMEIYADKLSALDGLMSRTLTPTQRRNASAYFDAWVMDPDMRRLPIIRNHRDYQMARDEALAQSLLTTENQWLTQGMDYQLRLPDGTPVVQPLQEGRVRLYAPALDGETMGTLMREVSEVGEEATAISLVEFTRRVQQKLPEAERMALASLSDEDLRSLWSQVLSHSDVNPDMVRLARDSGLGAVPIPHAAFENPVLAQTMSRVLNTRFSPQAASTVPGATGWMAGASLDQVAGRVNGSRGTVAFLDADEQLRLARPIDVDGVKRPLVLSESGGKWWRVNARQTMPRWEVVPANIPINVASDGALGMGVSLEEAVRAQAKLIGQRIDEATLRNWGNQTITERTVYQTPDRGYALEPGAVANPAQPYYDDAGRRVEINDPAYFSRKAVPPEQSELLHETLSPMLRDAMDDELGGVLRMGDDAEYAGVYDYTLEDRLRRYDAAPGERSYRSNWTDWNDTPGVPPVVIGPGLTIDDPKGMWRRFVNFGFDRVISPSIDAIARRPMAFHYFMEAMEENQRAFGWLLDVKLLDQDVPLKFADELQSLPLAGEMPFVAEDVRRVARVLSPNAGIDDLSDVEAIRWWHSSGHATNQAAGLALVRENEALVETYTGELIRYLRGKNWDAPVWSTVAQPTWAKLQGRQAKRIYLRPREDGLWFPAIRKPGKLDDVRYIDVEPGAYPAIMDDLRGLSRADVEVMAPDLAAGAKAPSTLGPSREQVMADIVRTTLSGTPTGVLAGTKVTKGDIARWTKVLEETTGNADLASSGVQRAAEGLRARRRLADANTGLWPVWASEERPALAIYKLWDEIIEGRWDLPYGKIMDLFPDEALRLTESQFDMLRAVDTNYKHTQQHIAELASQRAIENGLLFVDSHEIRSQFGEYVKGFLPFWYAEENFLKRWARTLKVAGPLTTMRKGQLLYSGLKSGGMIRTDEQGRDWFVYPGMGLAAEAMGNVFGDVLPAGAIFGAETKSMLPGFDTDRTAMPGGSPLVAWSVGGISKLFPEVRPVQKALVGEAGMANQGLGQFFPAVLRNIYTATLQDEDSSRKFASAMLSASQILEATGHGVPDSATPDQIDEYLRRLRSSTRTVLLTQAIGGFITPGSPQVQFAGGSSSSLSHLTGMGIESLPELVNEEWITLVRELGIDDGTIEFIARHPEDGPDALVNPLAFTVSKNQSVSGAPVASTAEALEFYERNSEWLGQYPSAGAWLMPGSESSDTFDQYAYQQQTIQGLRKRRTPDEFLRAMKFREGAVDYFSSRDDYESRVAQARQVEDADKVALMTAAWEEWSDWYLKAHPVFDEQLQSSAARQRRQQTVNELSLMLRDPATPDTRGLPALRELVEGFEDYRRQIGLLSDDRSAGGQERKKVLRRAFGDWAQMYVLDHPELEALWLTVLRPEAALD
jgi:hypothetical protein